MCSDGGLNQLSNPSLPGEGRMFSRRKVREMVKGIAGEMRMDHPVSPAGLAILHQVLEALISE